MCKNLVIFIRSCFCNFFFFLALAILSLFSVVVWPLSERIAVKYWHMLSCVLHFIAKYIAGIDSNVIGIEKIGGAKIYASRHESLWETMFLVVLLKNPAFVLKKELTEIPMFGQLIKRVGSISIDRSQGGAAMRQMAKQVQQKLNEGRPIIIFPEGTRKSHEDPVEIKKGIAMLYKVCKCSVVPIALNSGKFWPRRGFIKRPGTITVKLLDEIQPGLETEEFTTLLETRLQDGMNDIA